MDWETVAAGRGFDFQIRQRANGRWSVRRYKKGSARGTVVYPETHGLREYAVKDAQRRAAKARGEVVVF